MTLLDQVDTTVAWLERRIPEIVAEMIASPHEHASLLAELENAEKNLAGWRTYRQHLVASSVS